MNPHHSLTRFSIFSDSQAATDTLSGFVNNSRIIRECRRCHDLLSGRFTSVSLVRVSERSDILEAVEPMSSLGLARYFRNPPQLSYACLLPR